MSFLKHMRIWGKALATQALFAIFCTCLIAFAAYNILDLANGTQAIVGHEAANLARAAAAQEYVTSMYQVAYEMIEAERDDLGELQHTFDEETKGVKTSLAEMLATETGAAQLKMIREAGTATDEFVGVASQVGTSLVGGRRDEALKLLRSAGKSIFERADALFDDIVAHETADLKEKAQSAQDQAVWTLVTLIVTSLIGLAAVTFASLWIFRSEISRPLGVVTAAMNRLAEGDLQASVDIQNRRDEIGELATAFISFRQSAIDKAAAESDSIMQSKLLVEERSKALQVQTAIAQEQADVVRVLGDALARLAAGDLMFRIEKRFSAVYEKLREDFNGAVAKLQEVMKALKVSALEIHAGSAEISQSAEELSQRTEQQAASLEETAAALAEITSAVKRTADGTGEANNAVGAARSEAERSAGVVREAVRAMGEIATSARQISQIIGVIDEIAFQTNLLALNAGVEAARAGDAGRGFAVVASEVRALAQRSASAAKEIKSLISTSSAQVGEGVDLVGQTGQTLDRILTSIADINKLVSGMAQSAKEQSAGLHEINSAVDQMDHMTQQNASMVEESTAASFVLTSETKQLIALVERFKVDGGETPERQPVRTAAAKTGTAKPAPTPKRLAVAAGGRRAAATALKVDPTLSEGWEEF
jgi:methyl-accepting chemotaxis protein